MVENRTGSAVAMSLTALPNPLMMSRLASLCPGLTAAESSRFSSRGIIGLLPPRSMVGQLTLDQHIGVRIPGGQPL